MEKKTFNPVEFKSDSETGEFKAIFSRFNVIDRDNDITKKDAFTDGQKVRIANWGHKWNELPVGRGEIHFDEEKAWVDGYFFLDTDVGMETYKTVKNLGDLQEWSYGFDVLESERTIINGKSVREIQKIDVFEVSPVLIGAGIGTQTVELKNDKENNTNSPIGDESMDKSEDEDGHIKSSKHLSVEDYKKLFQILNNIGE